MLNLHFSIHCTIHPTDIIVCWPENPTTPVAATAGRAGHSAAVGCSHRIISQPTCAAATAAACTAELPAAAGADSSSNLAT